MAPGYEGPLAVMAFDHRSTFAQLLGTTWPLSTAAREAAGRLKRIILGGLMVAVRDEPSIQGAAALVDEELGGDLAGTVRQGGVLLAMPAEATAIGMLDFAYGDAFGEHIERFNPDLVKVLLRRDPRAPSEAWAVEEDRLGRLIDWTRSHDVPVILELIVPLAPSDLGAMGSREQFDREVRPALTAEVMTSLQDRGVEPDVWKLEGFCSAADCEAVARVAQRGGRTRVRCVVLGRGAELEQVLEWLRTARGVGGYSGFAIGRSLWWDPLRSLVDGRISAEQATRAIAANYLLAYRTFFEGRV